MKNEKVANYIGWSVMIFIADYWGYETYYTDDAAKVLDTKKPPEHAIMAEFEKEALRVADLIRFDERTEEANIFAKKILSGEFPEPLAEPDCKGMYSEL